MADVASVWSKDLVVIVGASGNQGSALIPQLYDKPSVELSLVCNSAKSLDRLKKTWPAAVVMQADLTHPEECRKAVKNATTIFHLGPSFHPKEMVIGVNMIDAAVSEQINGRLRHFVFSSVLQTQLRKLMQHDCKRYIEEYLIESNLNYTILRPSTFLDNLPVARIASHEKPFFPELYSFDVPFSFLSLRDLGEAAAKVILEGENHYFADYALASTQPITLKTILDEVADRIGKPIMSEKYDLPRATNSLCSVMFGEDASKVNPATRDMAEHMLLYYTSRGLKGNPNVLEWIIGRKATTYKDWVTMQLSALKLAASPRPVTSPEPVASPRPVASPKPAASPEPFVAPKPAVECIQLCS